MLNCVPYDRDGYNRLSSRFGTTKAFPTAVSGTAPMIQAITQVTSVSQPQVVSGQPINESWIYATGPLATVSGGNWTGISTPLYLGNNNSAGYVTFATGSLTVSSSSAVYSTAFGDSAYSLPFTSTANTFSITTIIETANASSQELIGIGQATTASTGTGGIGFAVSMVGSGSSQGSFTLLDNTGKSTVVNTVTGGFTNAALTITGTQGVGVTAILTGGPQGNSYTANLLSSATLPPTSYLYVGLASSTLGPITVGAASTVGSSFLLSRMIMVGNGHIYQGSGAVPSTNPFVQAGNQASAPLAKNVPVAIATIGLYSYLVDGVSIVQYDIANNNVLTYSATAGTAPTRCTMACAWRGRLCMAGDPSNPQNFYMARAGSPLDWNYAATDPAAAVAGNLSTSGQIGEPITALIPFSDDIMLIGCTHSLWMLSGDPADGGTIIPVSYNMGVSGPNAWTIDPKGRLWFVGSGGLYQVMPPWEMWRPPEILTAKNVDPYFLTTNLGGVLWNLAWDVDLHYLYIFATTFPQGISTHLIYDERSGDDQGNAGAMWPIQFPNGQGPTAVGQYFGDYSSGTRCVLLGGWDGYIRHMRKKAYDDDGTAINSFCYLGPIMPFPEKSTLNALTLRFGEAWSGDTNAPTSWGANVTINSGPDAYEVINGTAHTQVTWTSEYERQNKTIRQRLGGRFFAVEISNSADNTYWTFESGIAEFQENGRERNRR